MVKIGMGSDDQAEASVNVRLEPGGSMHVHCDLEVGLSCKWSRLSDDRCAAK